jgi:DNA-binding response OmpR family regulator
MQENQGLARFGFNLTLELISMEKTDNVLAASNRMLVVEDDAVVRELLVNYFIGECFQVIARPNGEGCVDLVLDNGIDICLIDIKLPGQDGLSLTHEIRNVSAVGIILVTSKDELVDRIVGLESGADDYVTKPFEMRELLSRVKNVIRRTSDARSASSQSIMWTFRDWTFDVSKRCLVQPDGESISLSEGEYQLLLVMVAHCGQVMTRDQLMQKIRNREWHPDDRYVDVLVVKLRQKFKKESPDTTFIATIHGQGYLFEPNAVAS